VGQPGRKSGDDRRGRRRVPRDPELMRFRGARGQIVPLYAIALPVMLAFVALTLDGGKLWVMRTHVQNAADASSLAASLDLGPCSAGCDSDPVAESAVRSTIEADINSYSSKNRAPPG